MDMQPHPLPWHLLQSFAVISEQGSLSAAARRIGASQPTLSRHLSQLEETLGTRLFIRGAQGLTLTTSGTALAERVCHMADAAAQVLPQDMTQDNTLQGTVRLSASQIAATYLLPNMLADLRRAEPGIDLEVVASDETQNLLRREADIAVRMYRPTQPDITIRKVAEMALGVYASKAYIARCGVLEDIDTLWSHDVIGYDRATMIIDGMRALGIPATRENFAFRCDDQVVCWKMIKAGFGIGFMQVAIGDKDPDLMRLRPDLDLGSLPVWLVVHKEIKTSARVRRVFDHLVQAFKKVR